MNKARRLSRGRVAAGLLFSIVMSCLVSTSQASVILSGNVASGAGVLTFTTDYSFTASGAGSARALIFDGWGSPTDGSATATLGSGPFKLELNGIDAGVSFNGMVDNLIASGGDLSPDDAYILWTAGVSVAAGDLITIKSGAWSLGAAASWNPATTGTFLGNMFLTDRDGLRLSGNVTTGSVPEPETHTLLLAALGLLAFARHLKQS